MAPALAQAKGADCTDSWNPARVPALRQTYCTIPRVGFIRRLQRALWRYLFGCMVLTGLALFALPWTSSSVSLLSPLLALSPLSPLSPSSVASSFPSTSSALSLTSSGSSSTSAPWTSPWASSSTSSSTSRQGGCIGRSGRPRMISVGASRPSESVGRNHLLAAVSANRCFYRELFHMGPRLEPLHVVHGRHTYIHTRTDASSHITSHTSSRTHSTLTSSRPPSTLTSSGTPSRPSHTATLTSSQITAHTITNIHTTRLHAQSANTPPDPMNADTKRDLNAETKGDANADANANADAGKTSSNRKPNKKDQSDNSKAEAGTVTQADPSNQPNSNPDSIADSKSHIADDYSIQGSKSNQTPDSIVDSTVDSKADSVEGSIVDPIQDSIEGSIEGSIVDSIEGSIEDSIVDSKSNIAAKYADEDAANVAPTHTDNITISSTQSGASPSNGPLDILQEYAKLSEIPPQVDSLFQQANMLHANGALDQAIQTYKQVLAIYPEAKEAYQNIGLCLFESGNVEEAIEHYDYALDIDKSFATAHYNKGLAYDTLGMGEQALEAVQIAVKLSDKNKQTSSNEKAMYLYTLGLILDGFQRRKEALDAYDLAIEVSPFDPDIWNNRGQTLSEMGRMEDALRSFKEAVECSNREDPTAWYNVASTYAALGDRPKAREALEMCRSLDLDKTIALFQNSPFDDPEALLERFQDERQLLLANYDPNADPQSPPALALDIVERLREIEKTPEFMLERMLETKGRSQAAYGSTYYESWKKLTSGTFLSASETQSNRMVVFGSSLGWQCFLGRIELGYQRVEGYEILESQVKLARDVALEFGLTNDILFHTQDALSADVSGSGLIWLNTYAWPLEAKIQVVEKLLAEGDVGAKVVSYEELPVLEAEMRVNQKPTKTLRCKMDGIIEVDVSWGNDLEAHIYTIEAL